MSVRSRISRSRLAGLIFVAACAGGLLVVFARASFPRLSRGRVTQEWNTTGVTTATYAGLGIFEGPGFLGSDIRCVRVESAHTIVVATFDGTEFCDVVEQCRDGRIVWRGRTRWHRLTQLPVPRRDFMESGASYGPGGAVTGAVKQGTGSLRLEMCDGDIRVCHYENGDLVRCERAE